MCIRDRYQRRVRGETGADMSLKAWRAAKLKDWNTPGSKLRAKHPSRDSLDAWMDRQCHKAVATKISESRTRTMASDGVAMGEPVVTLSGVEFTHTKYGRTEVLHGVDMELRRGEVLGMFGLNEAGKTTIARLIAGVLTPDSGSITFHQKQPPKAGAAHLYGVGAALVLALGMAITELLQARKPRDAMASPAVLASVVLLLLLLGLLIRHFTKTPARVVGEQRVELVTSEDAPGASFKNQQIKLLDYVTELVPGQPTPEHKRRTAEVLLRSIGFQMYDQGTGEPIGDVATYLKEGLTLEQCSGGQKHIAYVLRMLASQPTVLLADEIMSSLDQYVKARLTILLQHLLDSGRLDTILFISCDLNAFPFIANRLTFLHQGSIVEEGPVKKLMTAPANEHTRNYVSCHAMVTPSGKDLQALMENVTRLKPEVLKIIAELEH
eukprot:TRINITY_DN19327_c0_g1_i1.p1 TRINITY_DN19327_c0_g1~~TRINITY_DN19327_c0_g1_i1.p1  ORF type:complete len:438 (-),score=121.20 TRINITY_DN19327_c0_g1_i1:436-1749(-)